MNHLAPYEEHKPALSKAQRREIQKANRGGHNKREDVERYPSGGINYGATLRMEATKAMARSARMRVHGVSAGDVDLAEAGSVLGRLYLQGEFGPRTPKPKRKDERQKRGPAEDAYHAGVEFGERRAAYLAAISAPRPTRSGSDIGYVHEKLETSADDRAKLGPSTPEEHAAQVQRAKERYAEVRRAAMEADPLALMALETIVSEDKMVPSLIAPLRMGCNAIHRVLTMAKASRALAR